MKRYIFLFLTTAAFGTCLHFLYFWFPSPLIGVFAPVGESVWEHLKLLYWPWITGCFLFRERNLFFCGRCCISLLLQPPLHLGIYYTVRYGFGITWAAFDFGLYLFVTALGTYALWQMRAIRFSERTVGTLLMLCGLWGSTLLILSMAPLGMPIFQ